MDRARRAKRNSLLVLIFTAVFGIAGIPGTVIFASMEIYPLMAVCIALIVHAFYGTVFYAFAFIRASNALKVMKIWEERGITDSEEMAAAAMLSTDAARSAMKRCIERGYIPGYTLSDIGFTAVRDYRAKEKEVFCRYCGRKLPRMCDECPSCGAPVSDGK